MLKHEPSSSCNSSEVVVPKPSAHRWGATPPMHHVCEQLLSWQSCSCTPRRAAGEGWHWDTGGLAGSWVRPDGPHSGQRNARRLPGLRGRPARGQAQHCCCTASALLCLHVTGEQAAWHEAALCHWCGPSEQRRAGVKPDVRMGGPAVRSL